MDAMGLNPRQQFQAADQACLGDQLAAKPPGIALGPIAARHKSHNAAHVVGLADL
jgi:hypothetical protein